MRMGLCHVKNLFRPSYNLIWKVSLWLFDPPKGSFPVALQGIQRSGTNHLTVLLEQVDYLVLNRIDPKRDNPEHKHFRWQKDKQTIRMSSQYINEITAKTVTEINGLCRYREDQKHIVLFRPPEPWLNSIFHWGLENEWFPTVDAFFEQNLHQAYLEEWDAFYAYWADMSCKFPDLVMMLSHEDVLQNATKVIARIDAFMKVERPTSPGKMAVGKVRHSRPMSSKRLKLHRSEMYEILAIQREFEWEKF